MCQHITTLQISKLKWYIYTLLPAACCKSTYFVYILFSWTNETDMKYYFMTKKMIPKELFTMLCSASLKKKIEETG